MHLLPAVGSTIFTKSLDGLLSETRGFFANAFAAAHIGPSAWRITIFAMKWQCHIEHGWLRTSYSMCEAGCATRHADSTENVQDRRFANK